jgi:hypothetical protein
MESNMILGIDIGRVLISPDPAGGGDTSFIGGSLEAALATPPYEGMFEALPALVQHFGGKVWLVSKARSRVEDKTRPPSVLRKNRDSPKPPPVLYRTTSKG